MKNCKDCTHYFDNSQVSCESICNKRQCRIYDPAVAEKCNFFDLTNVGEKVAEKSEFTDEQYDELSRLSNLCRDYQAFVFENEIFQGLYTYNIKKYIKENPSKKFKVWMIDKGYRLNI